MRLAERVVDLSTIPDEYVSKLEIISAPPIIDIGAIEHAQQVVRELDPTEFRNFSALRLALTLGLYNFSNVNHPTKEQEQAFLARFRPLINAEKLAAVPANPLPTIGWEVEARNKSAPHFPQDNTKPTYEDFFKAMGWFNFNNNIKSFWETDVVEFSPLPSYTAEVSSRLLSELIKGGFVPSLRKSTDPSDIREYLGDKLISLHINLGVPKKSDKFGDEEARERVSWKFSSIFALGYSSSDRLIHRFTSHLDSFKSGAGEGVIDTNKGTSNSGRVEIKALEVRDRSAYRLMWEIQNLGAAFFESYSSSGNSHLANEWNDIESKIREFYYKQKFDRKRAGIKLETAALSTKKGLSQKDIDELDEGIRAKFPDLPDDPTIGQVLRSFVRLRAKKVAGIIEETRLLVA